MNASPSPLRQIRLSDNAAGIALGAVFTAALLFAMAYAGRRAPVSLPPEVKDLEAVAIPMDTPPPPPTPKEIVNAPDPETPLTGLEITSSDSSVKISVVPPDLAFMLPPAPEAPSATINAQHFYSEFRPKHDLQQSDTNRVFQVTEVDQRPGRLITSTPQIPPSVRGEADSLSVTLIVLVTETGEARNVRVSRSSGNPQFDAIIMRCVQEEWGFTPAIRKGRRVKCLIEQPYAVRWTGGSPFHL